MNKNNKSLIILLVIIIAGLLAYIAFKPKVESHPSVNRITHQDIKAGYKATYPSQWMISNQIDTVSTNIFEIENISGAILDEGGFSLKNNGSVLTTEVDYNMNYTTIDDFTKDPKYGLSQAMIDNSLTNVSEMTIDGKNLRVLQSKSSMSIGYAFIYGNKLYKINFQSGSVAQYATDYPIFADFVSSFGFQ